MRVISAEGRVVRIDAPEWFALDAFRNAVERDTSPESKRQIATFHRHGSAFNEFSDVFVVFDAREELAPDGTTRWIVNASDLLDEPGLEAVYDSVASVTQQLGLRAGVLWLTNIGLASV